MALGENIKRLRRDKKWTQGDLADRAGIRVGQISKLERNEADPKLDTLYKLMDALDCSPNTLLSDVKKTSLSGLMQIALERVDKLPERDQAIILELIDKWCTCTHMQQLMDNENNKILGRNIILGKTEELSRHNI